MHSQKFGPRPDTRNRSHRPQHTDNRGPKNHHEVVEAAKVSPLQGAARITNLKLLLEKSGGDIPTFAGRAEVSLENLRQILDGQKVMGDELATHVELTLELGQGWLDKQHQIGDITPTTVDILLGNDVSTFEKEIRHSEQKGHEIMKNTASTASTPSATPAASASKSSAQTSGSDKASDEIVDIRIGNLVLLTQARGAKSRLARLLEVSESIVSFLFSRNKEFTNSFTRKLETQLGLPESWMDTPRDVSDVPHATWEKLGSSPNLRGEGSSKKSRKNASAKGGNAAGEKSGGVSAQGNAPAANAKAPEEAPRGQRVHRMPKKSDGAPQQGTQQGAPQQGTLTLQLRTSAAPSVLTNDSGDGGKQLESQASPAASAPADAPRAAASQDVVGGGSEAGSTSDAANEISQAGTNAAPVAEAPPSTSQPQAASKAVSAKATGSKAPTPAAPAAPAPAASAPAASAPAAPAPAPAQGAQAESTATPAGTAVAFSPSQLSAQAAGTRPDVLELSSLFLSPITEALLKTLAIKAKEGRFTERDAYRLLGEITEM